MLAEKSRWCGGARYSREQPAGATLACVWCNAIGRERPCLAMEEAFMKRIMCARWFGFVCLSVLLAPSAPASTAFAPQGTETIRLPLSIIQSNPVTTIIVGERTVQAIVDTGGGALMLSKEVLDTVHAVRLGDSVVSTDASGRAFEHLRFRVPVATIGGLTFHDLAAIQAPDTGGPPIANTIGRQFLSQYFVVVDYAGAAITLWPKNTKKLALTTCGRKPDSHGAYGGGQPACCR